MPGFVSICEQIILLQQTSNQCADFKLNPIFSSICGFHEPDMLVCSLRCGQSIVLSIPGQMSAMDGQIW